MTCTKIYDMTGYVFWKKQKEKVSQPFFAFRGHHACGILKHGKEELSAARVKAAKSVLSTVMNSFDLIFVDTADKMQREVL